MLNMVKDEHYIAGFFFISEDIEKLIPLVCDSHSSLGEIKEFPTISTENPSARCTANKVTSDVSLQPNNRTEGFWLNHPFIIPLRI